METKIDTKFQICSSYSKYGKSALRDNAVAEPKNVKNDTFVMSPRPSQYGAYTSSGSSENMRSELMAFTKSIKGINEKGNAGSFKVFNTASDDYAGRTKNVFEIIGDIQKDWKESFCRRLENAGVPADTAFEFDYDIDTRKAEVTKISDEKYRDAVRSELNSKINHGILFTAYASRIMNGNISSAYYSKVGKNLEFNFGQNISDLYIDENGELCGANERLQTALDIERSGKNVNEELKINFPTGHIESILRRLVSDKNITPNISHMGYDGKGLYTNDGEFKFGKGFDPELLNDSRYLARGTISLYVNKSYDFWLNNEKMFY